MSLHHIGTIVHEAVPVPPVFFCDQTSVTKSPDARYSRQSRFAPVGEEGQARIRRSTVVLIGCGALGTVAAELLTRAGVGRLRIVDRDFVELSNLQRQFLFDEADAEEALPKAVAAVRRLARVNSEVELEAVVADLVPANTEELLENADVIVDGTDNFETRFLINDAAVSSNRPWIYSAAVGSYGLKFAIVPGRTACLRCIYPEPPQGAQPTCETDGVLGPLTSAIASLAAADALKILAAGPEALERASHYGRCLDRRHPADRHTGARWRVPVLRASRVLLSGWNAPGTDQFVRPQRRADSRAVAPGGLEGTGRAPQRHRARQSE